MNHGRTLNNRINSFHERALRLIYNNFESSFHRLLETCNSVTIPQCNLYTLALKIFKVRSNIAPEIKKDYSKLKTINIIFKEMCVCKVEM